MSQAVVGIIMGSVSDLDIMKPAITTLEEFGIPLEVRIISAHRTPTEMATYAATAQERGLQIIIAGAGGSAHLPGMTASETVLPVIAVPVKRPHHDHEALWSNVKMPDGVPLATMPENGSRNAALYAIRILALNNPELAEQCKAFVQKQHDAVVAIDADIMDNGWKGHLKD